MILLVVILNMRTKPFLDFTRIKFCWHRECSCSFWVLSLLCQCRQSEQRMTQSFGKWLMHNAQQLRSVPMGLRKMHKGRKMLKRISLNVAQDGNFNSFYTLGANGDFGTSMVRQFGILMAMVRWTSLRALIMTTTGVTVPKQAQCSAFFLKPMGMS